MKEQRKHAPRASAEAILVDGVTKAKHEVQEVFYTVHTKRDAQPDDPRTMKVEYRVGFNEYHREWVCVEHEGYAGSKAQRWWEKRCDLPMPQDAEEAVRLAEAGALARTLQITVRSSTQERFDQVVNHKLGPIPEYDDPSELQAVGAPIGGDAGGDIEIDDDDIPF